MTTKADLETQLDDLATSISNGLAALGTVIQNETQQVLDAIAAGQDLSDVSAKVTGIQTAFASALATVQTEIENIVTPPTPPTP